MLPTHSTQSWIRKIIDWRRASKFMAVMEQAKEFSFDDLLAAAAEGGDNENETSIPQIPKSEDGSNQFASQEEAQLETKDLRNEETTLPADSEGPTESTNVDASENVAQVDIQHTSRPFVTIKQGRCSYFRRT